MQRHHPGSGRRPVIPTDWAAHHRAVVASTHNATVTLRHSGGTTGAFDNELGYAPVVPHAAYYTGPARIQVMPVDTAEQLVAEQEVTTSAYAVMLDHVLGGMQLEDVCTVTEVDDNGDEWLVDRRLTVRSIESGSLHWERRLICIDVLETSLEA